MSRLAAIGVPIDSVGRARRGTEHAPAALRELGVVEAIGARDAGDLPVRIRGERRDPDSGVVAIEDVLATTSLRSVDPRRGRRGRTPFLLGCCREEPPGALAGARDALGRVGLAYVDGHLDLYDGESSPTGEAADMPVAVALGFGPSAWVESCGGASVDGSDVAILGFRDLKESLADGMRDPSTVEGLRLADIDEVRDAPADVGRDVAATLTTGPGRYWFHLDVDVLDEEVFPATDYLFAGGLTWEELQPLLGPLLSSPALLGASIGCYNPEKDPEKRSGRELVASLRLATG